MRSSIHLNADESRLLFHEYSGSNDSLVLYDTASCGKLAELDVSGTKWAVKPEGLVVGTQCKDNALSSRAQTRTYDFGGKGRVMQKKSPPGSDADDTNKGVSMPCPYEVVSHQQHSAECEYDLSPRRDRLRSPCVFAWMPPTRDDGVFVMPPLR